MKLEDMPIIEEWEKTYKKEKDMLKLRIIQSDMPIENKKIVYGKLEGLDKYTLDCSEKQQTYEWINKILDIPWGKYNKLPVNKDSDEKEIDAYLCEIKNVMDSKILFMDTAKEEILNTVASSISNPESIPRAIALKGPPGVGKTKLILHGVSKALNRPFRMISLGGIRHANVIRGSEKMWVGSEPGRITEILRETGCMNPIIYFDELDKVSEAGHAEVFGALTHLIDPTQVTDFEDSYYQGIKFDLSKVLFLFSYNDESKVNYIVSDRMLKLNIPDYTIDQKVEIADKQLLPEIMENIKINKTIYFSKDALKYIAVKCQERYKEKGVRNYKRLLETILLKINTISLSKNIRLSWVNESLRNKLNNTHLNIDIDLINNLHLFNEFNVSELLMYI